MRTHSRDAAALPLVLWALFVMSTVVVVALGLISFDIQVESAATKRAEARRIALSGIAYASHPKIDRGSPLLNQKLPNGDEMHVDIQNEDARLNINKMLSEDRSKDLVTLFRYWKVGYQESTYVADALKDWVDKDDFRSLNGAELADIKPGSGYSIPENRAFLNVDEMERVKGMDLVAKAKPNWRDYFSVTSSNKLDIQDVSPDLLRVFGGLTDDQVKAIVTFRNGPDKKPYTLDDRKIESVESLRIIVGITDAQLENLEARFSAGEGPKRIISRGICGGLTHQIDAVTGGAAGQGYLEWSEK